MVVEILLRLVIAFCAFMLGIIFTMWVWKKSPDGTMELGVNPEDEKKPAVIIHLSRNISDVKKRSICILRFKGFSEDL